MAPTSEAPGSGGDPAVELPDEAEQAIGRLDARALAIAVGAVTGAGVTLATLALVIKGGEVVGPNLTLLSHYFIGFRVSSGGAVIGGAYGFLLGALSGYGIARLRDRILATTFRHLWRRAERRAVSDVLDHLS